MHILYIVTYAFKLVPYDKRVLFCCYKYVRETIPLLLLVVKYIIT